MNHQNVTIAVRFTTTSRAVVLPILPPRHVRFGSGVDRHGTTWFHEGPCTTLDMHALRSTM